MKNTLTNQSFIKKQLHLSDIAIFLPKGYEKIYLVAYLFLLPYITGSFFLYFYVANSKKELFLSLNDDSSFILTWTLGYEILAVIAILYLMIKWFLVVKKSTKSHNLEFSKN